MPPTQNHHPPPAGPQQQEQLQQPPPPPPPPPQQQHQHQQQQLPRPAVAEEKGGDFFWDAHKAAAVGPARLPPGKHLDGPAVVGVGGGVGDGVGAPPPASPALDDGEDESYPGAVGISVFTFLKIVSAAHGVVESSGLTALESFCCCSFGKPWCNAGWVDDARAFLCTGC